MVWVAPHATGWGGPGSASAPLLHADLAAVQWAARAVLDQLQAVGAEHVAASVALGAVARGTEEPSARRAGGDLQCDASAFFVVLDRYAFKERVAAGAGGTG